MRKIIAIVLAVVMIAAMSIPAFAAAETTMLNKASNSGSTVVKYGVEESFVVVIPADFDLTIATDGTGTSFNQEVKVTELKINEGKKLTVDVTGAVDSTESGYNWALKDQSNNGYVFYNIFQSGSKGDDTVSEGALDGTKIEHGAVLFSLNSVKQFTEQVTYLDFLTETTIQAGQFQDTLTFTAEIKTA